MLKKTGGTRYRRDPVFRQPLIPDGVVEKLLPAIDQVPPVAAGMHDRIVHVRNDGQGFVACFAGRNRHIHSQAGHVVRLVAKRCEFGRRLFPGHRPEQRVVQSFIGTFLAPSPP